MKTYIAKNSITNAPGQEPIRPGQEVTEQDLAHCDIPWLLESGAIHHSHGGDEGDEVEESIASANKVDALTKDLNDARSELKTAQEALEPFQTRNNELANKVDALTKHRDNLKEVVDALTKDELKAIKARIADAKKAAGGS